MKKLLLLVSLLAAGGGAAFMASQGLLPGLATESGLLRKHSLRFIECLKYKEFNEAARFHSLDDLKKHPQIPCQLERFYGVPPELMDVQDFSIDFIDFDSTGVRARVKTTTRYVLLNEGQARSMRDEKDDQNRTRKSEAILYWKKVGPEWYMDLQTTLNRGGSGGRCDR